MRKSQFRKLIKEIVKQIFEDPDSLETKNGFVSYDVNDGVEAVVLFGTLDSINSYMVYFPSKKTVLCSDPKINALLADAIAKGASNQISGGRACAHMEMRKVIMNALKASPINWEEYTSARLFKIYNQCVFSFWDATPTLRSIMPIIFQFLKDFKYNPAEVLYQPCGYGDTQLQPYKEFQDGAPPVNRGLLNENIYPRLFWLNPSGEFIKVGMYQHDPWATAYLTKINKMPDDGDILGKMAELGWYRTSHVTSFGREVVEYDFPRTRPPSPKQIMALEDYAQENKAELSPRAF